MSESKRCFLGYGDHVMIEFSILGEARRAVSRTTTLGFCRATFGLFRDVVDGVSWEAVLKDKSRTPGRSSRKVLQAQEQAIPVC